MKWRSGPSMTTLSFRDVPRREAGDEILVTRLDHDANVSPSTTRWLRNVVTVRWAEINEELALQYSASKLSEKQSWSR